MTPERSELLRKVESFDIDGGPAELPFAARLARENGWNRPFAERVIREYKRYAFLAAIAKAPVCPSEDVDAAWHLHLTYTRSYWKRFCSETLGTPLHHEPTRGGRDEADKHHRIYEATLAAYREAFGEEPPTDIWPTAERRFGIDAKHRTVNTALNWVIPKKPVRSVAQLSAAFVLIATLLPGCDGGLNPFDLHGTKFLLFLVPMMIAAICLGRVIRSGMHSPGPDRSNDTAELSWEDAAYLAGGHARLTTAAIARLADAGAVKIVDDRLEAGPIPPGSRSPIEEVILHRLPIVKSDLAKVQEAVSAKFGRRAADLENDGYLLTPAQRIGAGAAAIAPIVAVILIFAVPRLLMGLANNKPVEFLAIAAIGGGFIGGVICLAGNKTRTRRAEDALERLRRRAAAKNSDIGDRKSVV